MANLCNNVALVYIKTANYKEAEEYLKKAAKINIQLNRYADQSINLSNLGLLYKLQGKFEEAEKAYLLALEINKKYKISIGKNLFNLAELYYENDKTELAIDYYSKVVIFVKSLPKASKKDLYMALESCNKIIIIAQKIGNNELEKDYKNKRKWFIEELRNLGEDIPED
jgi:tetratricopeptide (TPR) repeat protein